MATKYEGGAVRPDKMIEVEYMCYLTRSPNRAAKILAFTKALRDAIPPDNESALREFDTVRRVNEHPNMGSGTVTSVGAERIARLVVDHGVPVEVVNFLASIHLSPDTLPKE
jgi:hypothetical protein